MKGNCSMRPPCAVGSGVPTFTEVREESLKRARRIAYDHGVADNNQLVLDIRDAIMNARGFPEKEDRL